MLLIDLELDCSYMTSSKRVRGSSDTFFDFYCVFGQNLLFFFLTRREGRQISLSLG